MPAIGTTTYELLVIFPGSFKPSAQKAAIDKLDADVKKLGAISNKAIWENRPLAYKIARETTGTYFIVTFDAAPAAIPELTDMLRLDPQVIRYLVMKVPKHYAWKEYSADDLEHDFKKLDRDLFNEEAKADAKKPVFAKKTPAKKPSDKPAAKAAVDAKFDAIVSELK